MRQCYHAACDIYNFRFDPDFLQLKQHHVFLILNVFGVFFSNDAHHQVELFLTMTLIPRESSSYNIYNPQGEWKYQLEVFHSDSSVPDR